MFLYLMYMFNSSNLSIPSWWYKYCKLDQQNRLNNDEMFGTEVYGFPMIFHQERLNAVSFHLAVNYSSLKDYDLFWDHPRLNMWVTGMRKNTCPLDTGDGKHHHDESKTSGGGAGSCRSGRIDYLQTYTPSVKALENRLPLASRPNLLTHVWGALCLSQPQIHGGMEV